MFVCPSPPSDSQQRDQAAHPVSSLQSEESSGRAAGALARRVRARQGQESLAAAGHQEDAPARGARSLWRPERWGHGWCGQWSQRRTAAAHIADHSTEVTHDTEHGERIWNVHGEEDAMRSKTRANTDREQGTERQPLFPPIIRSHLGLVCRPCLCLSEWRSISDQQLYLLHHPSFVTLVHP